MEYPRGTCLLSMSLKRNIFVFWIKLHFFLLQTCQLIHSSKHVNAYISAFKPPIKHTSFRPIYGRSNHWNILASVNPPKSDLNLLIECYFLNLTNKIKITKKNNFHFKVRIKHIKRQRENSGWNTEDWKKTFSFLNVLDCAPFYKTLKYKIYIM